MYNLPLLYIVGAHCCWQYTGVIYTDVSLERVSC